MWLTRRSYFVLKGQNRLQHSSPDLAWKDAKPFNEIPGPSTFSFVRAFLPGGKYSKLNVLDLSKKMFDEYGPLARFPGLFGQVGRLL